MSSFTPDHTQELLLRLLAFPWASSRPAAAPLAEPEASAVARLALAHGLGPLLYGRLRGQDILPPATMAELRRAYYDNAGRSARLWHALETALRALAQAGIPTLLLKGAALVQTVYENPALRPMGDLDLLVRPADAGRALAALAGLGYRPQQHEPAPGSTRTYENEIMLGREGAPAPLELHWGLFDSPHYQSQLPMEWFWQTARPVHIGDTGAQALGPEAQILHLCGHLLLHHGGDARLLWLHDIAEVVARYRGEINWSMLLERARACDLLMPLQKVLPRVACDWQAPIPAATLEHLAALRPSRAEERIEARLSSGPRPAGRRLLDDLADTTSWRRRLHMALVNIVPTATYMQQRYNIRHRLLVPFFYPYRWFLGLRGLVFPRRA